MNRTSLWEKGVFSKSYDLIIVGAGIVGLSSALFYKQNHPSDRVLVLERGEHPTGASTRNAGFACIGSIGEHLADLTDGSEKDIQERIKRRYQGLKLLRNTLGERTIDYQPCGGYELFTSDTKFEGVVSEVGRFNQWMNEILGEKEVYEPRELEGYPVIYNRLEGALHPGKMMRALIQHVQKAGVEIQWNRMAQKVRESGSILLADNTELKAERTLLATNGFTHRLFMEPKVTPARGLVLVTNKQEQMPWKGTFHYDRGYIYFRNIGDRLLIGGARNIAVEEEETDVFGVNSRIKEYLMDFTSEVLHLTEGWTVEYEWAGIMGFTPDKTPAVEQLNEHCYIAAGLSGMGIAIGMEVGQQAAEMLSTNK